MWDDVRSFGRAWHEKRIQELSQRIRKLEHSVSILQAIGFEAMVKKDMEIPDTKPHYTRGQEVLVLCNGDYVNWWKKAVYLEKLKEDVHLVFIEESCKLGQFPDHHIQPLPKPEKPNFTRGQEVEVQMITGWTKGLIVNPGGTMSIVYVDEKQCSLPFTNKNIRPVQTTEG